MRLNIADMVIAYLLCMIVHSITRQAPGAREFAIATISVSVAFFIMQLVSYWAYRLFGVTW